MRSVRPLVDRFGRPIDYLRISLTERCDLRCAYCHPGSRYTPPFSDLLTPADVVNIACAAVGLGIRRIRLTGGEPLLRPDLEDIIAQLRGLPGLEDLSLSTNGQRLAQRAAPLAAAGLMRVNISLDSLDPQVYAAVTGGGDLGAVLRGLDAALEAALHPVKVNVVLASAPCDPRALAAFVDLARTRPVHVRFIEVMPTCAHAAYAPAPRVLEGLLASEDLRPVAGPGGGGPARYYRLGGSAGTLGVITPISAPFCETCNRLRVTARAELKPCLFSPAAVDLGRALGEPDPLPAVAALIREAALSKPRRYADIAEPDGIRAMHVIGG